MEKDKENQESIISKETRDKALALISLMQTQIRVMLQTLDNTVAQSASENLLVQLADDTVAKISITIEQEGLGHIDPPTRRAPTLTDLHHILENLTTRNWKLDTPKK